MNYVEYVRKVCEDRNIPVSTLEKECGFSNGYLNPKKSPKKIPYERAVLICQRLSIPLSTLGYPDDESIFHFSQDEIMFIHSFRRLSKSNQRTVLDNIHFLLSRQKEEEKEAL
ncbi:MAG: hypothetical protein IJP98_02420 [Clostridia bacterium]|nr:hypothetical protein [Clostridia bacterium]